MDSRTETLVKLHAAVADGELHAAILERLRDDPSCINECEVLDFKKQLPKSDYEYAKAIRDLIALHNSYGGFIVFGVDEAEKDRAFEVVGVERGMLDIAKIRDSARSYSGEDVRVQIAGVKVGEFHLEVLAVGKRNFGDRPVRFVKNGPEEKPGKLAFKKGDVVFRRIESNAVALGAEDYDFLYSDRQPPSLELPTVDIQRVEPLDNNLPDRAIVCSNFVGRAEDIAELWTWLSDDFSRVRLIAGEGGARQDKSCLSVFGGSRLAKGEPLFASCVVDCEGTAVYPVKG